MLIYLFEYNTAENQEVKVVSLKGFSSLQSAQEAPRSDANAYVLLQGVSDVESLGEPVLRALWNFKAKKPATATDPVDPQLTWELLQPKPRSKHPEKDKRELTPSESEGTSSSSAGNTAGTSKEKIMATKKKAAKKAVKKTTKKAAGTKTGPRGEKTLAVKALLERKSGCTREDILKATGWPAVSVPAMAKACGLKLRKEKEKGKNTRYYGE